MEVVLVRHGETEWSRELKHTGRTDVPLTEEGERQARVVGEALRGREFALVLSSPLRRALDTARLAGFEPELREELAEWDYGDFEGPPHGGDPRERSRTGRSGATALEAERPSPMSAGASIAWSGSC